MTIYTLKSHKDLRTSDGFAMTGKLCAEGVVIATYEDRGHGGEMRVDFVGTGTGATAAEAALKAHLATLSPMKPGWEGAEPMPWDVACFIGHLADEIKNEQRLKRLCAKKACFTVPGDPEGEFRALKCALSDKARAFILGKYPGAVIINDRFNKEG